MELMIAVTLRKLPVIEWHRSPGIELNEGEKVVVKTAHGLEMARILRQQEVSLDKRAPTENIVKEFVRKASAEDLANLKQLAIDEREDLKAAKKLVVSHNLAMKLLKAEYLLDKSRLILYFKSETKVDFRDLLKSLSSTFKTRIELRQIGVRDETKLLGGIGCCGKEVCCAQYMTFFHPVSTKMAKDQNLSLNPAKLSGICGRLLCCLSYEHKYYASFHGKFPKLGADILVEGEKARVMDLNYITQKLVASFPDRRKSTFSLEVIKGKRDPATGRNLWWVQGPGEPEPDLSILIPPPVQSKKNKKRPKPAALDSDQPDEKPDSTSG